MAWQFDSSFTVVIAFLTVPKINKSVLPRRLRLLLFLFFGSVGNFSIRYLVINFKNDIYRSFLYNWEKRECLGINGYILLLWFCRCYSVKNICRKLKFSQNSHISFILDVVKISKYSGDFWTISGLLCMSNCLPVNSEQEMLENFIRGLLQVVFSGEIKNMSSVVYKLA